jgi:hypothetical protein
MKQRWYHSNNDWRRIKNWPSDQSSTIFYRDIVFQGKRIYARAGDALYCFEDGAEDQKPPSVPKGLEATVARKGGNKVIELRWQESTDNIRVHAYHVSVNGEEQRRVGYPLAEFPAEPGQEFTFQVIAEDGSGNRSAASRALMVRIP